MIKYGATAASAALLVLLAGGCAGTTGGTPTSPSSQPAGDGSTVMPSPTPVPTPSQSSLTVATKAFCRGTIRDAEQGLDAITKLVKHPDGKGLTAEDFSVPRDNLSEDEQIAPPHLKKYLQTQIAVLDNIVAVFNGEGNRNIQTGKYIATPVSTSSSPAAKT